MKLSNFWSGLLVNYHHLRNAFADAQSADRAIVGDHELVGILNGFEVVEDPDGPSLNVEVGPGLAHDKNGARLRAVVPFTASFAADEADVSTAVLSSLNERWVALFLRAARRETTPQGPALVAPYTVNFESFESFEPFAVPGEEAPIGTAARPDLDPEAILLCEVLLGFGQTTIADADLDFDRTEIMVNTPPATGTRPLALKLGTAIGAIGAIVSAINDIFDGTSPLPAVSASYAGGQRTWADSTTVYTASPQSVQQCLIDLPAALSATGAGTANGASHVGSRAFTVGSVTVASGTLLSQLIALASAANISMPAAVNFSGTTVSGWLTNLTTTASTTGDGAYRVGFFAGYPSSGLTAPTVGAALRELDAGWGKLARANTWTLPQTIELGSTTLGLWLKSSNSQARFDGEVACYGVLGLSGVSAGIIVQSGAYTTIDGCALALINTATLTTSSGTTSTFNGPIAQNNSLVKAGSSALTAWRVAMLPPINSIMSTAADEYYQTGTLLVGKTHTLKSSSPTPPDGSRIRYIKPISDFDIVVAREDASEVVTMPAANYAIAEFTAVSGVWRLSSAFQVDLTTASP